MHFKPVSLSLALAGLLLAQEPAGSVSGGSVVPRARAIPVLIWNDPIPDGGGLAELRVIQPMLGGDLRLGSHFSFTTTINFEGATIPEGELALGDWGGGSSIAVTPTRGSMSC